MPTSVTWLILPYNDTHAYNVMCIIFYPSHHVHVSERSADLTFVRCGEMEGGEIFGTKAAKCFCPLHVICALAKVGDWQFYKLSSPNSFPHVISVPGTFAP